MLRTQGELVPALQFKALGNGGEKLLSHRLCVLRAEMGETQRSIGGGRSEKNCPTRVPRFTEEVALEMTLKSWGDVGRW